MFKIFPPFSCKTSTISVAKKNYIIGIIKFQEYSMFRTALIGDFCPLLPLFTEINVVSSTKNPLSYIYFPAKIMRFREE